MNQSLNDINTYMERITAADKDDCGRALNRLIQEAQKMLETLKEGNSTNYWHDGHLVRLAAEAVEQATALETNARLHYIIKHHLAKQEGK